MSSYQIPKRIPGIVWLIVGVLLCVGAFYLIRWLNEGPSRDLTVNDVPPFKKDLGTGLHNSPKKVKMEFQSSAAKVIDGKLSDWIWDDNSSFTTTLDKDKVFSDDDLKRNNINQVVDKFLYAKGAMADDFTYLYVAADIGDPAGLLTKNEVPDGVLNLDTAGEPQNYLEIRISPLAADAQTPEKDQRTQQQSRAYKIRLWYSANRQRAYLTILPALIAVPDKSPVPLPKTIVNKSDGFDCIFKQDGYKCQIEARIPWSLLPGRPSPDNTNVSCIWQIVRAVDTKPLRIMEIVDKQSDKFQGLKGDPDQLNEKTEGSNPVRAWGRATRK